MNTDNASLGNFGFVGCGGMRIDVLGKWLGSFMKYFRVLFEDTNWLGI